MAHKIESFYQPERAIDALHRAGVTHGAAGTAVLQNVRLDNPQRGFEGMFYCNSYVASVEIATHGDGSPLNLPLEVDVDPALVQPLQDGYYSLEIAFTTNGRTAVTIRGCTPQATR